MRRLADMLKGSDELLLTTHQAPDGDGVGSLLGLLHVLESRGAKAHAIIDGETPAKLRFLPGSDRLRDWSLLDEPARRGLIERCRLALVLDTHQWALLGPLGEVLRAASFPTLFLDHHPSPAPLGPEVFGTPEVSSTGELAWLLACELGETISPAAATCFYAALAYDTNSFKYLRGRPEAHRIAARLIEAGADTDEIYRNLFASRSPERLAILARVLGEAHRENEGRVAWLVIRKEWLDSGAIAREELRDVVTCLLETEGVEIAFTLQEEDGRTIKASLRSKGRVPVNGVARALGGGGHAFAAAAQWDGALAEAATRVLALLPPLDR
ncbi:MAG: DHH family phosphoesterase [Candidatus Eisenbacteria bacterium]|nr:DHH family phosphoesterase [Candidatus Eisenbacteria bacterium]